ncbi:VWA domain-containing protein [Nodularia spumigena]|uniref:VWA domain-containing protein n=1 Tax=Nodularia spumigena TaxID=70799 RepID=UPI00232C10E3|nr:VWA domain-containing protein [Nodularia spumigena]MDB9318508.1 VWA domain-containing protein [Nodularia spumigena CS-590/01A]MDB9321551.1 VWA domain-containing protein [Nodularia spumigena CS-591/07A]MDB9327150.1 VWA domain-containing protein [Nodularia spumigena CS-590/02]MDB9331153.1 VWA domain-containing protein [Nodularia spumigena CS-591/04]MDB9334037.1 VWA domain-containing protein [Nodularia spumigena CS-590/01]
MTLTKIYPGQQITHTQQLGLNLVSKLSHGRDVILAIDLTESVGLNNEARIRLRQIVEDSIKPGDDIYIVPFANNVMLGEVTPSVNPLGNPIKYTQKSQENIAQLLAKIPLTSDSKYDNTDIQRAELTIYQGIAQINHHRLQKKQAIKPQSVVWLTDAPLFTEPGITSNVWIETPADSSLRIADSPDSQERQAWVNILPLHKRSLSITNQENKPYTLTIVDIAPTVQEFCTPAPGNQETCLVNPYLRQQLWIPSLILLLILASLLGVAFKLHRLRHKWELHIYVEEHEEQICRLKNNQRIAIGEDDTNCTDFIDCPGSEVRAYLERQGENLFLVPNESQNIHYNRRKITSRTLISTSEIRLNFPDTHQGDYEISIKIKK